MTGSRQNPAQDLQILARPAIADTSLKLPGSRVAKEKTGKPTEPEETNRPDSEAKLSRLRRLDTPAARRKLAFGVAASAIGGLAASAGKPGPPKAGAEAPVALADGDAVVEYVPVEEWDIESTRNEQVDFFIDFLRLENRDKTKLWLERLGRYGPMIQQKLAERGMPQDLIWLATIESGLDPNAYSRADAAGLWQFIEETGERHGLEVSAYVDERRDPIASTDAALAYLQKLHDRFGGSWYLAAAGYNTGENRVERIVRERAGGRLGDESVFWEIERHLPSETRDYVPVMLAMGYIGKNPSKYGFTDIQRQAPLAFDVVEVPGGTPLAEVAKAAGVEVQTVYDLNPHLIRRMTPPERSWEVRIPTGQSEVFALNWNQAQAERAD